MNHKKMITLAFTSAILLAGCGSVDIEDVNQSAIEANESHQEIVSGFTSLYELESQIQDDFENSLVADEELSALADQSASVYENINQRHEVLKNIVAQSKALKKSAETIEKFEGEELGAGLLNDLTNQLTELAESLEAYQEIYEGELTDQGNYFMSIADDEANHKIFIDGMTKINEQFRTSQSHKMDIDMTLTQLKGNLDSLVSLTESLLAEEANE